MKKEIIKIWTIYVRAQFSEDYQECFKECVKLALEHECNVEFEFNDTVYILEYKDLLNSVKKNR